MSSVAGMPLFAARPDAEILEDLTPEQEAAVTHGQGPLLIVAGAGTGKTRIITRRIAWLIATKRARPEEILALTFTEKAAAEMETRVDELVPYGYVGATICTFHAFGDSMLREHAVELGVTTQLRVESDAEMLVFLREHLFELGLERYLPLGRPDEHLRALLKLFDRARDEDVSPEQYLEFARGVAAGAITDEDRDRASMELEKAGAYTAYQRLILEHGRIDFGAQISLALRLLRERPYLRREYEERYRYILVDEFQDTNHVQYELVRLLAGERRNITVVGDDDQSIYRFRGAKVENLLGFIESFQPRTVVLKHNYRSGQRVLDVAYRLIQNNNPNRLEAIRKLDKRLVSKRSIAGEVEHRSYRAMSDEVDGVVAEIEELLRGGTERGDIAVLARAHYNLEPFAVALQSRGIRFQRSSARGLYSRPEVQLCLNVLRSVADPEDSTAVFLALGHSLFGVDPVDLATIAARSRRHNRGLLALAATIARNPSSEITTGSRDAIIRFAELHRRLSESALRHATTEVLYEFAAESGLLERLAEAKGPEELEQATNLNKLLHIAQRIGPLLKHDRVDQFVRHLDLLIEAGDDPSAAELEIDENAVHLLTTHNAKGLEFPIVFLVQLVEGRFPTWRRSETMALPDELHRGSVDARADHEREERRLFYVAATRARDRLVMTHATDYGGKTARKASKFLIEALGLPTPPRSSEAPSPMQSIARFAPGAELPGPVPAPTPESERLELSHHKIDDYVTCPLKYRFAHIAHIPIQRDPRFMFGSAAHDAINIYNRHRMKGLPITAEDVIGAFEKSWSSAGFYTREHEERRLEEGRGMLRRFVEREEQNRRVPVAIETPFEFRLGTVTVNGRYDRIDDRNGEIVLIDYKTSDVEELERADDRAARSLNGEQLGIYALGYAETRGAMPARAELHFIDSGLVGSAEVRPEHLDKARERVLEAAAGIRRAEFPANPDPKRCAFCPFSRFCVHSAVRPGG